MTCTLDLVGVIVAIHQATILKKFDIISVLKFNNYWLDEDSLICRSKFTEMKISVLSNYYIFHLSLYISLLVSHLSAALVENVKNHRYVYILKCLHSKL